MKSDVFTKGKKNDRGLTDLDKVIYKTVTATLTIDTRKWNREDESQKLPIVVRVNFGRERVYLPTGVRYAMSDWMDLCQIERNGGRAKRKERDSLREHLRTVERLTKSLCDHDEFSLIRIRERFTGLNRDCSDTLYSVWQDVIEEKKEDEKVGTAQSYDDVYRRFVRDNGTKVRFSDIDRNFILKWAKKMKHAGLSETTVGISLRAFRVIVNRCINLGFIKGDTKTMFKESGYEKCASRKHEFLDVATWRRLYEFWEKGEIVDKDGKEIFPPVEKNAILRDLGLLIFCYLGNGMNLNDALRLRYNGWYFATNGRQMQFFRQKTKDRNHAASEVIFPVTKEIRKIIERHGNKPRKNAYVFPIMKEYYNAVRQKDCIHRYTGYIRLHMQKIAKLLDLPVVPTPTFARHSFATNLNNSGLVPYKYIADSMGHAGGGDITSRYIGEYPYEKMIAYNRYLLEEKGKENDLMQLFLNATPEERQQILDMYQKHND